MRKILTAHMVLEDIQFLIAGKFIPYLASFIKTKSSLHVSYSKNVVSECADEIIEKKIRKIPENCN